MDDARLIERARSGDDLAMRDLYRRYSAHVYAVVRRIAGEDALAEDWSQEAWIRVFRALPGFRGQSKFSTWLHRVAVNSALQGRRKAARHADREVQLQPVLAASDSPRQQVFLRSRLERAIERLPDRMRQVLVLHDIEGYTHEEIGELLGVTAGTSKSQLFKARARLREVLQPVREESSGAEACHI
ncbi:MAG TPA: sigma-70 family RNA polymerase sigma factor [Longimicrobiales bacterium]|nr:sigma-70 family RNA polymerase sigma factor [Longimicrobiales bacterium]